MRRTVALFVVVLAAGCSKERPRDGTLPCTSYVQDVAPLLAQQCGTCHSEERAEGSYVTTSYLSVLGTGSDDVPNAVSKDPTSKLLVTIDPETADAVHQPGSAVHSVVETWVLECNLSFSRSPIHEPGILDPSSADFHGALLERTDWDFSRCQDCHGESFRGGPAESSCVSCHTEGPTDCSVCHRPEKVDAPHGRHERFDCESCHPKPADYAAPGHLDGAPAEVMLLAFGHEGEYARDSMTCSETYCHGGTFVDATAERTMPVWGPGEPDPCGTCHGLPPSTHLASQDDCAQCHPAAAPPTHVNGVVELGTGEEGCRACHQQETGLHPAHLMPRLRLSSSVRCDDCHVVPEAVNDPGHIDSGPPAEVFPSEILGQSLAAKDGFEPDYDPQTATCSGVYCHGTGELPWTRSSEQLVFCGSCHGIPPVAPPHEATMTVRDCADCHASSVDGFGNILFVGEESEHLDGEIDL